MTTKNRCCLFAELPATRPASSLRSLTSSRTSRSAKSRTSRLLTIARKESIALSLGREHAQEPVDQAAFQRPRRGDGQGRGALARVLHERAHEQGRVEVRLHPADRPGAGLRSQPGPDRLAVLVVVVPPARVSALGFLPAEHQLRERRPLLHPPDVEADHPPDGLLEATPTLERTDDPGPVLGHTLLDEPLEDVVLAPEVVVHAADAEAGGRADLLDRRRRDPLCLEQVKGGVEDPSAPRGRRAPLARATGTRLSACSHVLEYSSRTNF